MGMGVSAVYGPREINRANRLGEAWDNGDRELWRATIDECYRDYGGIDRLITRLVHMTPNRVQRPGTIIRTMVPLEESSEVC